MSDESAIYHTLVLFRRNHELLLAMKKRGYGVGKWNGPGGKLKNNESYEECLIRECKEEIGIEPIKYEKVAYHEFINRTSQNHMHSYIAVYLCDEWEGEPEETEEMSPSWFPLSEIPYDHMWEDDALWLPMVLAGKKLKCTFYFDDDVSLLSAQIDVVKTFD